MNAIDPIAKVYDGFLIYSRFGSQAPLDGAPINSGWLDSKIPAKMVRNLRVPVLIFLTETDVLGTTVSLGHPAGIL